VITPVSEHPYLGWVMANLSGVNDTAVYDAIRATARPWWKVPVSAVSATAFLWALAYLYVLATHLI
jgi:hypothetical protein